MALMLDQLKAAYSYDVISGIFSERVQAGSRGRVKGGRVRVGYINDTGYLVISVFGKEYRAHRLAWFYVKGEWPKFELDHIDLNKLNNAWSNLRAATHAQNMCNMKVRKHSRLQVKGVQLHAQTGRFRARITRNGICFSLGLFDTIEQAHAAYITASFDLHGEYGRLN